MGQLFTPAHLFILLIVGLVLLLPVIFYLLTLQRAFQKCAPESRTISPGMVWLCLIPLVNFVMTFIVVLELAKSLGNEFNRRGIPVDDPAPGKGIGLAMSITLCCSIIPILGAFSSLAYLVLWIMYWVKIAGYSRALDAQPVPLSAF